MVLHLCTQCDYQSSRMWNLRRHMEDMHGHQIGGGYGREDDISDSESVPDTPDDSSTESKDSSAESDDSSAEREDVEDKSKELIFDYQLMILFNDTIKAAKGRIQDHLKIWPKLDEYEKKRILKTYAEYKIKMMDQYGCIKDEDDENEDSENEYDEEEENRNKIEDMINDDIEYASTGDTWAKEKLAKYEKQETEKLFVELESDREDEDDENEEYNIRKQHKQQLEEIEKRSKEEGNEYFKSCSNEKIKTICFYCNGVLTNPGDWDPVRIEKYIKIWKPIGDAVDTIADPSVPLSRKRLLLQKHQVGEGIVSGLTGIVLPGIRDYLVDYVQKSLK